MVCTNFVLYVAYVLWSYSMKYALCVVVIFMIQKLASMTVIVQSSTNVIDQFPEKIVLGGTSTKGSGLAALTQNGTTVPFDD